MIMKQLFYKILNKSQKGNEKENELQEYFNTLLSPTKTCSLEETATRHRLKGSEAWIDSIVVVLQGWSVPMEWQTRTVVSLFKKGDQMVCSQISHSLIIWFPSWSWNSFAHLPGCWKGYGFYNNEFNPDTPTTPNANSAKQMVSLMEGRPTSTFSGWAQAPPSSTVGLQ